MNECEQLILNFINPYIFMNNAHICMGRGWGEGGGVFMTQQYFLGYDNCIY